MSRPIANRFVRFPRRFGWWEVLGFARDGSLEWVRRHALVVGELERMRQAQPGARLTVLDFGGAIGSLARALRFYMVDEFYEITLVDIDREAVDAAALEPPLTAKHTIEPQGALPFGDGAFDIVVSGDVFEHIPADARAHWASELRRVARIGQVHTFPCDSLNGRFDSSAADRALDAWHRARFGLPERWTAEHIAHGVPTVEAMAELLNPSKIIGIANVDVWLETIKYQFGATTKWHRLILGVRYLARRRRMDRTAPFKACIMVVEASGLASPGRFRPTVAVSSGAAQ